MTGNGAHATYRAPTTAPPGNQVRLNVSATTPSGQRRIAVAVISVGRQASCGGTIEATTTTSIAGGTITVTSRADVSFRWNKGQQAYTPNGNLAVRYDVSNPAGECEAHMTGAGSIIDGDGQLRLISVSGQTLYTGGGFLSRQFVLSGTSTCNDKQEPQPVTLDQTGFGWWPFIPPTSGGYPLRNNGTTMKEDIQSSLGGPTTRVKWLLTAGR